MPPESVELRPPRLEEFGEIAALINRAAEELYGEREETETTIRLWLTAPELDLEHDVRLAVHEGRLAGYADLAPHPEPKFWLDVRAAMSAPDEVRETLLGWGEERAQVRAATLVRAFTSVRDTPWKAALERHGYDLIRHSYRMRIDFEEAPPDPDWPDGVVLRSATSTDIEAAYDVYVETFQDTWEFAADPFEKWRHWMVEDDLDFSLWFFAEDGGEVAGVALCAPWESEQGLGWVRVLGVRRPWRRKGLGRALLLHAFGEFHGRGFHGVGLGVDAESLTGAHRLYERAGMRVFRSYDIYEKALGG
ncbi:MAG TPA: GNAT family N-acetyltransferase [Gaiellaceae bacterium]|nr:GNAT family N-acetyltransferase [Gaiellaceae bacterium]